MSNVIDDLTTRFKSFSDSIEQSIGSIDLLPGGLKDLRARLQLPAVAEGESSSGSTSGASAALARSRVERDAARARGEAALTALPPGYAERGFDAVEHELRQLGEDAGQAEMDAVVERLTAAVEVASERLAKHVLKNQEKLVAGITNVINVEDDLQAAHVICRGSRAQLRMAAEEVRRQITVITSTRKKQRCMEVLEALTHVKRVKELPGVLRKVHQERDFAEAILLCVDGFQAVEALGGAFTVVPDLRVTVQRQYYDTLQRLDAALLAECCSFTTEGYSKLLEAYLLQGVPGPQLAGKVLSSYKDGINDAAVRLVRSWVLARAAPGGGGGGNAGAGAAPSVSSFALAECTFEQLCARLAPEAVQPCVAKLLEALADLMGSYDLMAQWHEVGLQQQQQQQQQQPPRDQGHAAGTEEESSTTSDASAKQLPAPTQAQLDQVRAATTGLLEAVSRGLVDSRASVLDLAGARVRELLAAAGGRSVSGDFLLVAAACLQFASLGEAFAGELQPPLRASLLAALGGCLEGHHRANMDVLRRSLAREDWSPVDIPAADVAAMKQHLAASPLSITATAVTGECFGAVGAGGNPFQPRLVGGQTVLPKTLGQAAAAATQPQEQATSGATTGAGGPPASRISTRSGLLVLRWLAGYAALMAAPVPVPRQQLLWRCAAELFDNYLLACFVLFSGVTLEELVWQDDCLPNRLRGALLRITTSAGCKYKAQVEELQRTKPQLPVPGASSSGSLLDFGAGGQPVSGASKLDALTRRLKDTMVELINTDLSQPMPSAGGAHSPSGGYFAPPAAQQQQQQQQQQQVPLPRSPQQPGQPSSQPQGGGVPAAPSAAGAVARQQPARLPGGGSPDLSTAAAATAADSSAAQPPLPKPQAPGVRPLLGLKERAVAVESLTAVADALRAARPGLASLLAAAGGAPQARELDGFFARTVDAAADLRDTIYTAGARQLLVDVTDGERGTAAQIAACDYAARQPATQYQAWASNLISQYRVFAASLSASGLPANVQQKMWESAVKLGGDAVLDGVSQVAHCSLEGRAAMSLDLSAVEKGLRLLAPPSAMAPLRLADNYIKAFYTPWEELARWAQVHVAEYGRRRVLALIEAMAEAYGVRRGAKAALIERLGVELAEFA